ncbi:MAG TPA: glycosyltransferase family 39 protein, partial [Pyrinomonadaceae bacterium]|nr:glycosyltransferase family 39 protein [Pyrinomonadaceae bacterium]
MLGVQQIAVTESQFSDSTSTLVSRWSRWSVFVVFAASVFLTITFRSVLPSSFRLNESSDYAVSYEPVARNILLGRGFTRGNENLATEYPPGYPLLLAGTFAVCSFLGVPEETGVSSISVFGMGLVSVFIFLLTRQLWGVVPALISALMWMTYPFALWLTKQPSSEIPYMVVLYGGLCLFWYALVRRISGGVYFLCGLLFGVAMLIRPAAVGIALVLSVIIWFGRREVSVRLRCLMITMLLLGNLAVVLPWEAWVYAKTGQVILLSTNGARGMRDGLTFAVSSKGYREDINVSPDVARVMEDILAQADQINTVGQVSSAMAREFRSHPAAVAKLSVMKIARSWYGTDSGRRES